MPDSEFPKAPGFEEEVVSDDLMGKYRLALVSGIGAEVLKDILINLCHFGCYLQTPGEVAQYNVGVAILSRCGIMGPGMDNELIAALCGVVKSPG